MKLNYEWAGVLLIATLFAISIPVAMAAILIAVTLFGAWALPAQKMQFRAASILAALPAALMALLFEPFGSLRYLGVAFAILPVMSALMYLLLFLPGIDALRRQR